MVKIVFMWGNCLTEFETLDLKLTFCYRKVNRTVDLLAKIRTINAWENLSLHSQSINFFEKDIKR